MQTIINMPSGLTLGWQKELSVKQKLILGLLFLLIAWLMVSTVLQLSDPAIAVLDFGTFTLAVFGILLGWLTIYISVWLQEMLWQPFKIFRQNFYYHFNQLTSWQQCILYFSVFFLLLLAVLKAFAMVF
ncbi:hypothetical protein [Sphingobacterium faecale]|uniref:Uncharacterized protein n=1 Tax=Sphingobacterium faecale TaxID=2803775 RepID=A0ABS1R1X1_9SPHI|nr:hypothetical protein [Sphingobacterium faecale]MBL1408691.1 hypothetical protein [Sphingobacterium faecale]